jgi:hypothetical protein
VVAALALVRARRTARAELLPVGAPGCLEARSQEPSPAATYSASHAYMLTLREPAGALECGVHGAHAAFAVLFL